MPDQPNRLLADATPAGIVYAFELDGALASRGRVATFEEIHGLAVRAGLYAIEITARRRRLEAEAYAKRYGWTLVTDPAEANAHNATLYAQPPAA
jgi:hypothetical protein